MPGFVTNLNIYEGSAFGNGLHTGPLINGKILNKCPEAHKLKPHKLFGMFKFVEK